MAQNNPNLQDVIDLRAANREERQLLETRLRSLATEDQDLAVAERVLTNLAKSGIRSARMGPIAGLRDLDQQSIFDDQRLDPPADDQPSASEMTQEEVVHFVMSALPEAWMTSNKIQDEARKCGKEIPMSSLSPMLSNLKAKGIIERDGLKVALTSRVKNKAAAE